MTIPDAIERAMVVNTPAERVWHVLTGRAFLGGWSGGGGPVPMDLRPGGLLLLAHGAHRAVPARIETVDPPRSLSWQWSPGAGGGEPAGAGATLVQFTLAPAGDGGATALTMVESGFARLGLPVDEAAERRRASTRTWPGRLALLRAACHPGGA